MLLLRIYEQSRGIYFLRDHSSLVSRGGELYVIVLLYVGSDYVVWCIFFTRVWYTISSFSIVYNACLLGMRLLMHLLMLPTWMQIHHMKLLLSHRPMIMIVSG